MHARGQGGRPRIPLLPSPNKDEGTQIVLVFLLNFFPFFQDTSVSFKKRVIKKMFKKKKLHPRLCLYIAF